MKFIYYSADEETIYFLDSPATDHGVSIGRINTLPDRPAFIVQSLLSHAGYGGITGLTFVYGERQPPPQEEEDTAA